MRILIVDDSEFMRNVIRKILEHAGYTEFLEADCGADALNKLSDADMILTDLNMPEMCGDSLIREIKNNSKYKDTPICVITSQNDLNKVGSILRMGVDDYISKPFNQQCLTEKVRKLEKKMSRSRGLVLN